MQVERSLESLRKELQNCDITAFGDLSSGLILRSNTAVPCRREVLDALCEKAGDGFSLLEGIELPQDADTSLFGSCVVELSRDNVHIFSRSAQTEADFVCARLAKTAVDTNAVEQCCATAQRIQEDTE